MSLCSGYDSEAIGFDSIAKNIKTESESSSQTTGFTSNSIGSQATTSETSGTQTGTEAISNEALSALDYTSLNAFLQRVVPSVLEALNENNDPNSILCNSSESEDEETINSELFQVLDCSGVTNETISRRISGGGDQKSLCILSLSWSSAGNTLAVSLGQTQHEEWCEHDGLIRIYTVKRSAGDKLTHSYDITHDNCISVLQYHPTIAALLAYATNAGEVVVRNLRNATVAGLGDGAFLTSPAGTHSSRRVSTILWADAKFAINLLMLQPTGAGKRRGASDQVLLSTGTDGSVIAWQVNANLDIFTKIMSFQLGGASLKQEVPDITCLDFLRCTEGNSLGSISQDIFVVGCKTGQLMLCNIKNGNPIAGSDNAIDPAIENLEPHHTCVLGLSFSSRRPGIFASISTDAELRIYNVHQSVPLKVICLEYELSCLAWVPNNAYMIVLGLGKADNQGQMLALVNTSTGKRHMVEGLNVDAEYTTVSESRSTTAIAINAISCKRIATGNNDGKVMVWEIPVRRMKNTTENDF